MTPTIEELAEHTLLRLWALRMASPNDPPNTPLDHANENRVVADALRAQERATIERCASVVKCLCPDMQQMACTLNNQAMIRALVPKAEA